MGYKYQNWHLNCFTNVCVRDRTWISTCLSYAGGHKDTAHCTPGESPWQWSWHTETLTWPDHWSCRQEQCVTLLFLFSVFGRIVLGLAWLATLRNQAWSTLPASLHYVHGPQPTVRLRWLARSVPYPLAVHVVSDLLHDWMRHRDKHDL